MKYTPVFKKKEILVKYPEQDGLNFGSTVGAETLVEVLYVGEKVEKYKVGDKILVSFNKEFAKEITFFEEKLWRIETEDYVICQVIEQQ